MSGLRGPRGCAQTKGMKIALDLKALWKGLPLVVVVILGIVVTQGGVWLFRAMVSAIYGWSLQQ